MCLLFLKLKTKEKYEDNFFLTVFISKIKKFGGSTNFFSKFFSVLIFKTIDTHMLFDVIMTHGAELGTFTFWIFSKIIKKHIEKVIFSKISLNENNPY